MNINEAFPSKYLKAPDLNGRRVKVTISHAQEEKLGDETKIILYFVGKNKGLVLNKTNANNMAAMYGYETDDWQGVEAELYEVETTFQGQATQGLRIKPVPVRRPAVQAANGGGKKFPDRGSYGQITSGPPDDRDTEQQRYEHETSDDDEIPF